VLQLEIPLETVRCAAGIAHDAGVRVVLNPSPAQPLDPSLMRLVDVLVANETEIGVLSGQGDSADPVAGARQLLQAGPSAVVVTLGARGALVVSGEGDLNVPAFSVNAVDSTGAGDCFLGNLAHALEGGQELAEAVRFASAAAALSVGRPGAQASMPSGDETRSFLQRQR
jgi:ribokinase